MPVIKRYANRKLYDTDARRYISLDDVAEAIRRGEEVRVVDHDSGDDLTSITLMQILFEEQKKIGGLLPGVFLARVIRAGSNRLSSLRNRVASLDPFQTTIDDEIRRRVGWLVEREELSQEEADRMIDLLGHAPPQADVVRIPVKGEDEGETPGETVPGVESELQPAEPAEMEVLLSQVEELERELERLKQARA
jgi:polyhydroxyalkanoate synthesis repressor PhaR